MIEHDQILSEIRSAELQFTKKHDLDCKTGYLAYRQETP